MSKTIANLRGLAPGISLALVLAAAATFLSEHYSAPVMLYALLLGMAFNFLTENARVLPGVEFSAKALLRIGVALLGFRIGWSQIAALGWEMPVMVIGTVAVTIGVSILLARAMGFNPLFGFLSGGATAICGASAALALSASLPPHPKKEQATLFTVIGVSALSTIAMIAYPVIANATGLSGYQAGVFIGATIHDVAQVVGAGYAISPEAGDTATIVKLMRVAMLLPVILIAGQIGRSQAEAGGEKPPLLPWFIVVFGLFVVLNSLVALPQSFTAGADGLSRWCLVTAIAAIGVRTRLSDVVAVGLRPVILMIAETALLATMVIIVLKTHLV